MNHIVKYPTIRKDEWDHGEKLKENGWKRRGGGGGELDKRFSKARDEAQKVFFCATQSTCFLKMLETHYSCIKI